MARTKKAPKRRFHVRKIMNNHEVRAFKAPDVAGYLDLFAGVEPLPRALGTEGCMKQLNPFLGVAMADFPPCVAFLATFSPFVPSAAELTLYRGAKDYLPKTPLPTASCVMFIGCARTVTLEHRGGAFVRRALPGTQLNCLCGLTIAIGRAKGATLQIVFV